MELVEPALVQLIHILDKPSTSDSDRLRAIQMVLDRTGYGSGTTVQVEVKPWEVTFQKIIREIPAQTSDSISDDGMTIDAELVEDDSGNEADDSVPMGALLHMPIRVGSAEPPKGKR